MLLPARHDRLLLAASTSALALLAAWPAAAQSPLFARRGADPTAQAIAAARMGGTEAARAATAAQASVQVFARAAQVTAAMGAVQAAARAAAAAAPAAVPNGLAPGGLVPVAHDPGLWIGARQPEQAAPIAGRTQVTVRQSQERAILTWRSFNLGRETDLVFDQSAGGTLARQWSVLNRIEDPSAQPSRILGSIRATGQVTLVNRNGIIFGGGSQVDVGTLVASALDVGAWVEPVATRNARFAGGILKPLAATEGAYTPTYSYDRAANAATGRIPVEVQAGATILAREEGSVALFAPQVANRGSIAAPSGQVILAAGLGVRLDRPESLGGTLFDAPRIGLAAEALRRGPVADPVLDALPHEARNEGSITATRGSITLTGFAVTNTGVLAATTANNRPGSVFLTARDFGGATEAGTVATDRALYRFGPVTLGPGSLVGIQPETGADQLVYDSATAPFEQGRLAFNGSAVLLGQGALVHAPAASLRIAGDLSPKSGAATVSGTLNGAATSLSFDHASLGRLQLVSLAPDAVIDLGGLKSLEAPVARNLVEVLAFRNELRDAPVQRDGLLFQLAQQRQGVVVDTRLGTGLVDWQPTAGAAGRSVLERLGAGGSLEILAERVFTAAGSRIDVSGGALTYQGGLRPAETRLVGSDGRIYQISAAPADLTYVALAGSFTRTQPRWGITQTFRSPFTGRTQVFEPGYVEGFDAGSVAITGRFYGDGVIEGSALIGSRQAAAAQSSDGNRQTSTDLPRGGTLRFLGQARNLAGIAVPRLDEDGAFGNAGLGALVNPTLIEAVAAPLPADFAARLVRDPAAPATGDARFALAEGTLPATRFDTQLSTADILGRGFADILIEADGRLTLPAGVTLTLPPGGSLTARVWSADLQGGIRAPSGSIAIATAAGDRVAPPAGGLGETLAQPVVQPVRDGAPLLATDGTIIVGPQAVLSTRGRWVNDLLAGLSGQEAGGQGLIHGGSITLQTSFAAVGPEAAPRLEVGRDSLGNISFATPVFGRDILLQPGAVLDVSGGGHVAGGSGRLTAGRGGSLTLGTYAAPAASPTGAVPTAPPILRGDAGIVIAGRPNRPVTTGATLLGYGTAEAGGGTANGAGGTLTLTAPRIVLGRPPEDADAEAGILVPDLDAFAAAGFSDLRLTATLAGGIPFRQVAAGGITVVPGAVVAPVASAFAVGARHREAPSGSPAAAYGAPQVLAATDRTPMRLTLAAANTLAPIAQGTLLRADPGAAGGGPGALISLSAAQPILIAGTLEAPAGDIRVTGTNGAGLDTLYGRIEGESFFARLAVEYQGTEFRPDDAPALWLAATARLLAPGVARQVTTASGLPAGTVRPGGTVTLGQNRGYLVLEAGSLIDVSGVAGETGRGGAPLRGVLATAATVALPGDAGSIGLSASRGTFLDGTLQARPGGPGARGGTLTITAPVPPFIELTNLAAASIPTGLAGPLGILVRQSGPVLPAGARFGGLIDPSLAQQPDGTWRGDATDRAFLAADTLAGSGIDRLNLVAGTAEVLFQGNVALAVPGMVQIDGNRIGTWSGAGNTATPEARIATRYLALRGTAATAATALPDWAGPPAGTLGFEAQVIDVLNGAFLVGAARTTLTAADDIRLTGTTAALDATRVSLGPLVGALRTQGDLTLRAAQIYPTTGTEFTLAADGGPGALGRTLAFERAGGALPRAPLSAAGTLVVAADRILQGGVVRAPEGQLRFQPGTAIAFQAGSLTSVSGEGRTILYGETRSEQNPLGVDLVPTLNGLNPQTPGGLTAPLEKAIVVGTAANPAPEIRVEGGAALDASGGAELLAYRFVAGPGGSRDVLARSTVTVAGGTATASNYQFTDQRDVFALLPGAQPFAAPYSPYIIDSGSSLGRGDVTAAAPATGIGPYGQQIGGTLPSAGDQVRLDAAIPGLPAGTYTLLPGRYALLPGAFRVTVAPASAAPRLETPIAAAVASRDGSFVVPGIRQVAGTSLAEARQRLFQVSPRESWSRYSTLLTDTASGFFAGRAARLDEAAPRLPVDAGRLTLAASRALVLDGTTLFGRGPGGRGGQVEISAERIAVTPGGAAYADPAFLPISDLALSSLGAETLTIGGTRIELPGLPADQLVATARGVVLAAGASLTAPEVVLVARAPATGALPSDGIRIEAGALLAGQDTTSTGIASPGTPRDLQLGRLTALADPVSRRVGPAESGDATLVRVSAGPQQRLLRQAVSGGAGTALAIGEGARLVATTALLDVTGDGAIAADAGFAVGGLSLAGNAILLADPAPGTGAGALRLGSALLAGLGGVRDLALRSRGAIDVAGPVALAAAQSLTLDAAALRGFGAASLEAAAGTTLALLNSAATDPGGEGTGAGRLTLRAGQGITLGGGTLRVSGFPEARLETPGILAFAGTGGLALPGSLALAAARLGALPGASFDLVAAGAVAVRPPAAALADLPAPGIGGRLSIQGTSLSLAVPAVLHGGSLTLTATAGDLALLPGGRVDASGFVQAFFDVTRATPGGNVTLNAALGSVLVAPGVALDVSGAPGIPTDAGSLALVAQAGTVAFEGASLSGQAAEGALGGRFALDAGNAADLGALGARLDAGGFFGARIVHTRAGDLDLAAGSVFQAREVSLTADGGRVAVAGTIDASGPRGGSIGLWGRDAVVLAPGARLLARATEALPADAPRRPGGTVEIGTLAGPILAAGATIDVGAGPVAPLVLADGTVFTGRAGLAEDPLHGGLIRLRVPFQLTDRLRDVPASFAPLAASRLGFTALGARRVELEPFTTVAAADYGRNTLAEAFARIGGTRFVPRLPETFAGAPAALRVTPGIEVAGAGGITLAEARRGIDLSGLRTEARGGPAAGVLTFRSGGNLEILASLSDGFDQATAAGLQIGGTSWSYRLVGGAEIGSANPLATRDQGRLAPDQGSVLVGRAWDGGPATSPVIIRTGTGSIDLAAARDVLLRDPDAVVYTAGRPIADRNRVAGFGADGRPGSGTFHDPAAPTYGSYGGFLDEDGLRLPPAGLFQAGFAEGGGDLRVRAGRDILAAVVDGAGLDGAGNNAGQTVSAWLWRQGAVAEDGTYLYRPALPRRYPFGETFDPGVLKPTAATSTQTAWFVNFGLFRQNFGVLGGGNADVRAGRDFQGSISIPTTARTGGGLAEKYETAYCPSALGCILGGEFATLSGRTRGATPAVRSVDGGGDLTLQVGRDILAASQFYLGRGEGLIRAGGALRTAPVSAVSQDSSVFGTITLTGTVGTVLGLGEGRYQLVAGGNLAVSVYDPFQVPAGSDQQNADAWGHGGTTAPGSFSTYADRSAVSLQALGGDITVLGSTTGAGDASGAVLALRTAAREGPLPGSVRYRGLVSSRPAGRNIAFADGGLTEHLPANFAATAFTGDITVDRGPQRSTERLLSLAPSPRGQLELLAGNSIPDLAVSLPAATEGFLATAARPSYAIAPLPVPDTRPNGAVRLIASPDGVGYLNLLALDAAAAPSPLEAPHADDPQRALIYALRGDITSPSIGAGVADRPELAFSKRVALWAGRDVTDFDATIQHALPGDLSFIRAGRDIGTRPGVPTIRFGNTAEIRGPGRLQLIAGRDIAPIRRPEIDLANNRTGPVNGIRSTGNAANPDLPAGAAAVDMLFGVGPGPGFDAAGFLDRILDGAGYRVELATLANGGATSAILPGGTTAPETLARIRALPQPERLALAIDLYFRELDAAGREATAANAAVGSYDRGFGAIAALFPFGGYGGNLNLQNTVLRTEQGGDINVLGPGGDFFLGGVSATVDRFPDRVGVLTLGYGNINIFARGDIQAGQSRVFTIDGGDILMWSSTADINAGLGARTARFVPPFQVTYREDGLRTANRTGLVTGSGIGTYDPFTPLDEVPALVRAPATAAEEFAQGEERRRRTAPGINLIAPVGAVDFGDAGVRAAGNLNVAAQTVLNAQNVQVGGTSTGVPAVAAPNVAGAVAASAAAGQSAGAAQQVARQAGRGEARPQDPPALITVQVLGFGGSEADAAR